MKKTICVDEQYSKPYKLTFVKMYVIDKFIHDVKNESECYHTIIEREFKKPLFMPKKIIKIWPKKSQSLAWSESQLKKCIFEIFMMSIYEKTFLAKGCLIHPEQMSLHNFIILRKKQWTIRYRERQTWNRPAGLQLFEKETLVFSCGTCETFNNSGGCFWKQVIFYYVIKNYIEHKLAISNAVFLLYYIYC